MPDLRSVCVYAGSSIGTRPAYAEAARTLGRLLADRGLTTVYGGGAIGLMGVLADAALEAGGQVIGVIPRALRRREVGHDGLTELRVVESMHDRKLAMAELADAFIALPGGIGTLEELIEVHTWTQLGIHDKPCSMLDIDGYYQPLIGLLDHAVTEGFLSAEHRAIMLEARDPVTLLDELERWQPPRVEQWLDAEQA